jgi:hypothetical protein
MIAHIWTFGKPWSPPPAQPPARAKSAFGVICDHLQHEPQPTSGDDCARSAQGRPARRPQEAADAGLGSVLVSFTPVRDRSPVVTRIVFAQFANSGGRG